jgi:hypothetical protein
MKWVTSERTKIKPFHFPALSKDLLMKKRKSFMFPLRGLLKKGFNIHNILVAYLSSVSGRLLTNTDL